MRWRWRGKGGMFTSKVDNVVSVSRSCFFLSPCNRILFFVRYTLYRSISMDPRAPISLQNTSILVLTHSLTSIYLYMHAIVIPILCSSLLAPFPHVSDIASHLTSPLTNKPPRFPRSVLLCSVLLISAPPPLSPYPFTATFIVCTTYM